MGGQCHDDILSPCTPNNLDISLDILLRVKKWNEKKSTGSNNFDEIRCFYGDEMFLTGCGNRIGECRPLSYSQHIVPRIPDSHYTLQPEICIETIPKTIYF